MRLKRLEQNPIVISKHAKSLSADMRVIGTFNPGTAICEGEFVLLVCVVERPILDDSNDVTLEIYHGVNRV